MLHALELHSYHGSFNQAVLGFDPTCSVYAIVTIEDDGGVAFHDVVTGDKVQWLPIPDVTEEINNLPPDADLEYSPQPRYCNGRWSPRGGNMCICVELRRPVNGDGDRPYHQTFIVRFV